MSSAEAQVSDRGLAKEENSEPVYTQAQLSPSPAWRQRQLNIDASPQKIQRLFDLNCRHTLPGDVSRAPTREPGGIHGRSVLPV